MIPSCLKLAGWTATAVMIGVALRVLHTLEIVMGLVIRFVVGGIVVSLFAILGDALKPKSFAGLLSAAPSVALATIGLTVFQKGKLYAAIEARSMILGSIAFLVYAAIVFRMLVRGRRSVIGTTGFLLVAWLSLAFGLEVLLLG